MGEKKIKQKEGEDSLWRFSIYENKRWIRISDIMKNTDWSRDAIERRINNGTFVKKKLGGKTYILWDSWLAWTKGE